MPTIVGEGSRLLTVDESREETFSARDQPPDLRGGFQQKHLARILRERLEQLLNAQTRSKRIRPENVGQNRSVMPRFCKERR